MVWKDWFKRAETAYELHERRYGEIMQRRDKQIIELRYQQNRPEVMLPLICDLLESGMKSRLVRALLICRNDLPLMFRFETLDDVKKLSVNKIQDFRLIHREKLIEPFKKWQQQFAPPLTADQMTAHQILQDVLANNAED